MIATVSGIESFVGDAPLAALAELAAGGEVAWDIETSGLEWSKERIATCQLANRDGRVLLVRIDDTRPANLCRILADPGVVKLFHYAVFDLSFMTTAWLVRPANIACTKVCSRLLAPQSKEHSLKSLLKRHLGVVIDKGQRLSDWFAETLTKDQQEYAANDVIHLPALYDTLREQLAVRGLAPLADECFRHLPARVAIETGGFGDVFAY